MFQEVAQLALGGNVGSQACSGVPGLIFFVVVERLFL